MFCACADSVAAGPAARPASSRLPQKHQQTAISPAAAWRPRAAAGLAAAALLLAPFPAPAAMDLSFAPSSVKESLEARDEAAEMKCKQMFDCDGDRREYAKQQWADFVARGGVPERKAAAVAANPPSGSAPKDAAGSE